MEDENDKNDSGNAAQNTSIPRAQTARASVVAAPERIYLRRQELGGINMWAESSDHESADVCYVRADTRTPPAPPVNDVPIVITKLTEELAAYLDSIVVTSENIGDIRRSCFMPWDSEWNGIVRGATAKREIAPPVTHERRVGEKDRRSGDEFIDFTKPSRRLGPHDRRFKGVRRKGQRRVSPPVATVDSEDKEAVQPDDFYTDVDKLNAAKNNLIPRSQTAHESVVPSEDKASELLPCAMGQDALGNYFLVDVDGHGLTESLTLERAIYLRDAVNSHAALIAVRDAAQDVMTELEKDAAQLAIAAGIGVSEWQSCLSENEQLLYAALAATENTK